MPAECSSGARYSGQCPPFPHNQNAWAAEGMLRGKGGHSVAEQAGRRVGLRCCFARCRQANGVDAVRLAAGRLAAIRLH